jgi:WD40 repeat protein
VKALADGGAVFVRMTERLERRAADGTIAARAADRNILDIAVDGTRTRIFTNALHGFAERDRDSLELLREVEADPPLKAIPRAIAVSPDASRVVLGDRLGHLTALDADTGRVAWSHAVPGEPIELRGVAVSPDGTLAAGVGGAHILVAELATGALVWSANTSGRVFRAPSFSADSRELLAATWVESVDRFDARTGRALGQATGVFSQVWATAAAPGGDAFAAGGLSARTVVFPADASIAPTAIALDGSPVTSIALGRRDTEGTLFAVTGSGALHAIDRATRRSRRIDCGLAASAVRVDGLGRVVLAHQGGIAWLDRDGRIESKAAIPQAAQRITVLDDEHIVAICGEDASGSKAYLVRRDASRAEHTLFPLPDRGIACGGAAPGAEPGVHYIPSGNARETLALRVRDPDGSPLAAAEFREILDQPELPRVAALSPDRTLLAIGSVLSKGEVAFADPRNWRTLRLMPNHRGSVHALAWSPDGTRLASCATDDTVRLWHRERAVEILVAWRGACADLAWADDGELWLACGDGCVRVLALPHAH